MSIRARIFSVIAAMLGSLVMVVLPSQSAHAAGECIAYATLPARISINVDDTIVRSTLASVSGCRGWDFYGADANFDGPDGQADWLFWDAFGTSTRMDLWSWANSPGTYVIEDATVDIEDSNFNQIPVVWQNRYTSIRFSGHLWSFTAGHANGVTNLRAQAAHYSAWDNNVGYNHVWVMMQRRPLNSSTWSTFGGRYTSSTGWVSYSYRTSQHYVYRLAFRDHPWVWGATSVALYR